MPRVSANALNVVQLDASKSRPKITPIGSLTRNERRVFDHTVRENGHLKRADIPMLELFAIACCRTAAAKHIKGVKGTQAWEREARTALALGRSLRVTPQSTTEPKTAARRRAEQAASYYDRMEEE
jgi:hypothetical protein